MAAMSWISLSRQRLRQHSGRHADLDGLRGAPTATRFKNLTDKFSAAKALEIGADAGQPSVMACCCGWTALGRLEATWVGHSGCQPA